MEKMGYFLKNGYFEVYWHFLQLKYLLRLFSRKFQRTVSKKNESSLYSSENHS